MSGNDNSVTADTKKEFVMNKVHLLYRNANR